MNSNQTPTQKLEPSPKKTSRSSVRVRLALQSASTQHDKRHRKTSAQHLGPSPEKISRSSTPLRLALLSSSLHVPKMKKGTQKKIRPPRTLVKRNLPSHHQNTKINPQPPRQAKKIQTAPHAKMHPLSWGGSVTCMYVSRDSSHVVQIGGFLARCKEGKEVDLQQSVARTSGHQKKVEFAM